jgi:hypothetical protein
MAEEATLKEACRFKAIFESVIFYMFQYVKNKFTN